MVLRCLATTRHAFAEGYEREPIGNLARFRALGFAHDGLSGKHTGEPAEFFVVVSDCRVVLVVVAVHRIDEPRIDIDGTHDRLHHQQTVFGESPVLDRVHFFRDPCARVFRPLSGLVAPWRDRPAVARRVRPLPRLQKQRLTFRQTERSDIGPDGNPDRDVADERFSRLMNEPRPELGKVRVVLANQYVAIWISKRITSASSEWLNNMVVFRCWILRRRKPLRSKPFE